MPTTSSSDVWFRHTDAALAMYSYDWALTLDMEINLVWLKKWTAIEAIYLFQRYAVIFDACILAIYRECHAYYAIELHEKLNDCLERQDKRGAT